VTVCREGCGSVARRVRACPAPAAWGDGRTTERRLAGTLLFGAVSTLEVVLHSETPPKSSHCPSVFANVLRLFASAHPVAVERLQSVCRG